MQQAVEEEKITLVTLVTCPEAADGFCKVCYSIDCSLFEFPTLLVLLQFMAEQVFRNARLVTASFDLKLNSNGHVVPGIGCFEERYRGAPSTVGKVAENPPTSNETDDENALIAIVTSWFKKD